MNGYEHFSTRIGATKRSTTCFRNPNKRLILRSALSSIRKCRKFLNKNNRLPLSSTRLASKQYTKTYRLQIQPARPDNFFWGWTVRVEVLCGPQRWRGLAGRLGFKHLLITQARRLRLSTMKKCSVGVGSSDTPVGPRRQRAADDG